MKFSQLENSLGKFENKAVVIVTASRQVSLEHFTGKMSYSIQCTFTIGDEKGLAGTGGEFLWAPVNILINWDIDYLFIKDELRINNLEIFK